MDINNLVIGSEEWKEWRRSRIGASDSSVILGLSPYKTPLQLWEEKVLKKDPFINKSMQRGNDREAEALFWFECEKGINLNPKIVKHPLHEWKYATLDGISEDGKTVLEIKWANAKVHSCARRGEVISYYYPQCQSQMECAGVDQMYFLSCHEEFGVPDYQLVLVKKDPDFIEKMINKEKEFYKLMVDKIPPVIDKKEKKLNELDEMKFNSLCEQYSNCCENISAEENIKEEIKKQILSLSGNSNTVSSRFKVSKIERKGSVDYNSIPALLNVNLDDYRKPSSESWKISVLQENID